MEQKILFLFSIMDTVQISFKMTQSTIGLKIIQIIQLYLIGIWKQWKCVVLIMKAMMDQKDTFQLRNQALTIEHFLLIMPSIFNLLSVEKLALMLTSKWMLVSMNKLILSISKRSKSQRKFQ